MINDWLGILLKNFNVLPRDGKVCFFLLLLWVRRVHCPDSHCMAPGISITNHATE
jgi:hypothetical protein